MADTLFPKREERVPYGSGTPAKRDRKNTKGKKTGRTNRNKPTEKKRGKKDGKKLNRNALYLIGIIVILFIVFLFVRKNGSAVYIADEQVGILETRKVTAKELTATLESQLEGIVGSKVQINEKIKVEGIHIGSKEKKDVCTMEHLLPKMRSKVTYKVEAAIITVDSEKVAKEGVAEDAEISWQEDVEVVKEFVDSTQILEQEDAVKVLESTTEATQSYTVQSGDAPYLIANEFKTTVEKLNQLNEGANLTGGIRVGQVINVPVQKPKISVKTVETQVLTAVEPKTYQTQYDDTKPSSYQKVIQQGKAGQKKSTIRITRINGEVTEEKEVDKEIIQEAVPEIIVKGTQ